MSRFFGLMITLLVISACAQEAAVVDPVETLEQQYADAYQAVEAMHHKNQEKMNREKARLEVLRGKLLAAHADVDGLETIVKEQLIEMKSQEYIQLSVDLAKRRTKAAEANAEQQASGAKIAKKEARLGLLRQQLETSQVDISQLDSAAEDQITQLTAHSYAKLNADVVKLRLETTPEAVAAAAAAAAAAENADANAAEATAEATTEATTPEAQVDARALKAAVKLADKEVKLAALRASLEKRNIDIADLEKQSLSDGYQKAFLKMHKLEGQPAKLEKRQRKQELLTKLREHMINLEIDVDELENASLRLAAEMDQATHAAPAEQAPVEAVEAVAAPEEVVA